MLRIEVMGPDVEERRGDGWTSRKQTAYVHLPDKAYPQEIKIRLEDGQAPYPKGNYTLAPESIYIDKYKSLAIGAKLVPLAAQRAA